jgi:hypothetical protein
MADSEKKFSLAAQLDPEDSAPDLSEILGNAQSENSTKASPEAGQEDAVSAAPSTTEDDPAEKEDQEDPDEERRAAASQDDDPEDEQAVDPAEDQTEQGSVSDAPEQEDLIGEHAGLFTWDEESESYLPKDEESARAIAALGDDLDVQRLDPETGTHAQMEYSLLNREMLPRKTPRLMPDEDAAPKEEEAQYFNARQANEQGGGKKPLQENRDSADFLVNSVTSAACRAIDAGLTILKHGFSKAAEAISEAATNYRNNREQRVSEVPGDQANDISSAVQAESLDDEDEVTETQPQPGAIGEKLKASAGKNTSWVDEHVAGLREGVVGSLASMSKVLDLEGMEQPPETSEELESHIQSLPEEEREQVEGMRSKISSTIDQARESANEWITGNGPRSFSALYEQDPKAASEAKKDLESQYEDVQEKAEKDNKKLWDLLELDSSKGASIGDSMKGLFDGIKASFQNMFDKLVFRASAAQQPETEQAPGLG